ncbi:MAG: alpha/beta fold hydrolase [Pseudomonadota bacterium]|nr:alpha/beta fold hydrolase [Pseudomonadota bacterium]MDE3037533.1 alpha/beta fold hydrolase [Pseudomonadota bacterium]
MTAKDYSFYLEGTRNKGVLLVHGLTGSPAEMKFIGKQLHRKGFTVYAPTLAGHGSNEVALKATRYEDWTAGLQTALRYFRKQVPEVHTAGICVGGALALYLAYLEPEAVSKVAIYAPALDYDGWNQPKWSRAARVMREALIRIPSVRHAHFKEMYPFGIKSDRIRSALVNDEEGIEGTLPNFPAVALYENYRLNHVLKNALPGITTPTLIIHAREDDVSHPRNSFAIQKRHGGVCDVVLLEDSYHMIHVDQERHKVADLTASFFGISQIDMRVA